MGKWERIYQELGKEALYQERRGRASRMRKEKQKKRKEKQKRKRRFISRSTTTSHGK